jgi:drug/metabolite transporter (DMT)-like permease
MRRRDINSRERVFVTHSQANRLMILAAVLWGTGNVAQQTVLEHVGPFTAVALRCLIATLLFLPLLLLKGRHTAAMPAKSKRPALLSALAFAAAVTFSQAGYGETSVTNAGFFINTTTVITPILAWLMLAQRPHVAVWFAAGLILVGATLMSGGSLQGLTRGDLFCLAAALSYSLWMIFLSDYARQSGDATRMTIIQFSLTALVCIPFAVGFEKISATAIGLALPELLFLSVFSTAGAYYLQIVAQKYTSASEAAVIGSGEALVGAFAAYLILGEVMTGLSAAGSVLVFAGIVLVQCPALMADLLRQRQSLEPEWAEKQPLPRPAGQRPNTILHPFQHGRKITPLREPQPQLRTQDLKRRTK